MKITLISQFFDARNGGTGSYSKLIYNGLTNFDVNLQILSQDDGIFPSIHPMFYYLWTTLDLKRLLSHDGYKNSDIYHCFSPLESLYVPKKKSVSTILDFIPFINRYSFKDYIHSKFFKKGIESALKCEHITVLNSDLKSTLISHYGIEDSKIDIIVPPIDSKFCPMDKDDDSFVVGTVSGISKRKRVDILLKSFLKADIDNSKLLIGGNGPDLHNLKSIAKGDERVKFLGFIDDDDMNKFYNSLDVFVFPTSIEGYGMPMVEAMACGKPVITIDDSIMPSDIKDRTYVCSKEELSDVLLNKSYSCNIQKNIDFSKNHSVQQIGSKIFKIYNSI